MTAPNDENTSGWSPMMIGGAVVLGLVLLLLIPTLRAPDSPKEQESEESTETTPTGDSQCERSLMSAVDGLQPTRLGLSAESRVMVDTLNNWLTQCADPDNSVAGADDEKLRQDLLMPASFEQTQLPRYQDRDTKHVRNCLLASQIVDRVTRSLRSDRARAVELFYYVVRTIDLLDNQTPDLWLTPYESLFFGVGSAADRAWTYALLLQQLRLDCLMVQPRVAGESPYWIIGVVIPGEGVLAFDPRLGLPISPLSDKPPETPLPRQAATLTEIRENDALLRQYDREGSEYPLHAKDFETIDVFAIGTSSDFAPRMGYLQAELPFPLEIYNGLASNELRENGLIERLTMAGADGLWTADQVRVWPYPQQRWQTPENLSDQQQVTIERQYDVVQGPFVITAGEDEQGNVVPKVSKPQTPLHEARVEQLMGNFEQALQVYLRARLAFQDVGSLPLEEVQLNAIGADMATFWAAQSQYEQQDFRVAAESAMAYINQRIGNLMLPSLYLASVSLAREGRFEDAASLLAQQPAQTPQYRGDQWLVQRWRRMASGDTDSKASKDNSSADSPAPSAGTDPPSEPESSEGATSAEGDASETPPQETDEKSPANSDETPPANDPPQDTPPTDKPTTDKPTTNKPTTDEQT